MKKIINRKKYDTATATEIGCFCNGYDRGNFEWYEETLYLKKTGEYFLYGEGGPLSPYDTDSIEPLTLEEAKDWVESYLDADIFIELFGDVEE